MHLFFSFSGVVFEVKYIPIYNRSLKCKKKICQKNQFALYDKYKITKKEIQLKQVNRRNRRSKQNLTVASRNNPILASSRRVIAN